jgi:hypothetical protein
MPNYIELDKQASFPNSTNVGKLVFGVTTSNELLLTDSSGTTYNFGSGATTDLSYQTFDDIDLNSGDFVISGSGIYRVTVSTPNALFFPNPTLSDGGTIIVMNSDPSNSMNLNADDGDWLPFGATSGKYTSLPQNTVATFYSIGGKWRGTYLEFLT